MVRLAPAFPVYMQVPVSVCSSGMQRGLAPVSSFIFFSSWVLPEKKVSTKPPLSSSMALNSS